MKIACVKKSTATSVDPVETSWSSLCHVLSKVTAGEKDGFAWIPAEIESGPRKSNRVKAMSALVLDIENTNGANPPSLEDLKTRLTMLGYTGHVHTSYSHSPDSMRCRIVVPLDFPLQPSKLKGALQSLAEKLGLSDCWDTNCTDPARLFYTPRCPPGKEGDFKFFTTEGTFITETDLDIKSPRPCRTELGASHKKFPQQLGTQHNNSHMPKPKSTALDDSPNNCALVAKLLSKVSSDCDRDIWRSIVWSVLSTGLTGAEELARDWSIQSDRYTETDFDNLIRDYDSSFEGQGGKISIGTLYHFAKISEKGTEQDGKYECE